MYSSEEHQINGYKAEISILPLGNYIGCTTRSLNFVYELEVLCNNYNNYEESLKRVINFSYISDVGLPEHVGKEIWNIKSNTGYEKATESCVVFYCKTLSVSAAICNLFKIGMSNSNVMSYS